MFNRWEANQSFGQTSSTMPPDFTQQEPTFKVGKEKPGSRLEALEVLRVRYQLVTRENAELVLGLMCDFHLDPTDSLVAQISNQNMHLLSSLQQQHELVRAAWHVRECGPDSKSCHEAIARELNVSPTIAKHYIEGVLNFIAWSEEIANKEDPVTLKSICNNSKHKFMARYDYEIPNAIDMEIRIPSLEKLIERMRMRIWPYYDPLRKTTFVVHSHGDKSVIDHRKLYSTVLCSPIKGFEIFSQSKSLQEHAMQLAERCQLDRLQPSDSYTLDYSPLANQALEDLFNLSVLKPVQTRRRMGAYRHVAEDSRTVPLADIWILVPLFSISQSDAIEVSFVSQTQSEVKSLQRTREMLLLDGDTTFTPHDDLDYVRIALVLERKDSLHPFSFS
ncbi:hypothetical protein NQ176_g6727 [Zarea fungicola]|uniref:Uncharacterized protein n=1 Tax=Zarea fungicola TaxID=93591 RepID=A0ACC1N1V5_9HYPO|nr:hypothetical protein NQ176_g6727 [Lecanicillium fungicola]